MTPAQEKWPTNSSPATPTQKDGSGKVSPETPHGDTIKWSKRRRAGRQKIGQNEDKVSSSGLASDILLWVSLRGVSGDLFVRPIFLCSHGRRPSFRPLFLRVLRLRLIIQPIFLPRGRRKSIHRPILGLSPSRSGKLIVCYLWVDFHFFRGLGALVGQRCRKHEAPHQVFGATTQPHGPQRSEDISPAHTRQTTSHAHRMDTL